VDYVILYVRDMDDSIAFYRDVIGLPFRFRQATYAEFATEGTKFALFERSAVPELIGRPVTEGGPTGEVAFVVDDVDAEAARLAAAGIRILSHPTDRPWGHRTVYMLDPDDHVVELAQEIPRESPRPPDQS
jgi:lactoylglutathione lyase